MNDDNQNKQFNQNPNEQAQPSYAFKPQQSNMSRVIAAPTDSQGVNGPADPPKPKPVVNTSQIYGSWQDSSINNNPNQQTNQPAPTSDSAAANTAIPPVSSEEEPLTQYNTDATGLAKKAFAMLMISLVTYIPFVGGTIANILLKMNLGAVLVLIIIVAIKFVLPIISLVLAIIALIKIKNNKFARGLPMAITTIAINTVVILVAFFVYLLPLIIRFQYAGSSIIQYI